MDAPPPPRAHRDDEAARWLFALDRHVRRPYLGVVFAGINAAVFAWMVAQGVDARDPSSSDLLRFGANAWQRSLADEPWRLLTSGFLHVGLVHLVVNGWCILQMGLVERMLGRSGWLAVFVVSIVAGSLLSAARHGPVSAGASGGLFGLLGAVTAFGLASRQSGIPAGVRSRLLTVGLQNVALNAMLAFFIPQLDHWAHGGGFVAGAVLGLALLRAPSETEAAARPRRAAVGLAMALVVMGAAWWMLRGPAREATAPARRQRSDAPGLLEDETRAAQRARATSSPPPLGDAAAVNALRDRARRAGDDVSAVKRALDADRADLPALATRLAAAIAELDDTIRRIHVARSASPELSGDAQAARREAEGARALAMAVGNALEHRAAIERARAASGPAGSRGAR